MNIIPFPRKHAPGIIDHVSPAMARAFRALEREGLNTETARTLADAPAETPKDFCLKLSLLSAGLEIMKGTDWDETIDELWLRAFQGKPLPEGYPTRLGVTLAFFELGITQHARFACLRPLLDSVDRDFERLVHELMGVCHA